MPPSIVPEILVLLRPYLNERAEAWLAQPEGQRTPTLPTTHIGASKGRLKVSVMGIAEALSLQTNQVQHLHKKDVLRSEINALARDQGLMPITHKSDVYDPTAGATQDDDDPAKLVIKALGKKNKALAERLIELEGIVFGQQQRIQQLEAQLRLRTETGMTLITGLVRSA